MKVFAKGICEKIMKVFAKGICESCKNENLVIILQMYLLPVTMVSWWKHTKLFWQHPVNCSKIYSREINNLIH